MKIFEFQFNPKARQDRFFFANSLEEKSPETFSQESLVTIGELKAALPQNSQFLKKVADQVKNEYVLPKEGRFKRALQKANEFFGQQVKSGNVDWLGNLNLALVSFSQKGDQDKALCSFTRKGSIRIFVTRKGMLVDIGKDIAGLEHLGKGTLVAGDKIIVATQEVFELFTKENIFRDLIFLQEEKQFRELFRAKAKELLQLSGILYVVLVEPLVITPKEKRPFVPSISLERTPSLPFRKEIVIFISLFLLLAAGYILFK